MLVESNFNITSQRAFNIATEIAWLLEQDANRHKTLLAAWKSFSPSSETWKENYSIYHGCSGILLFYLELYEVTRETRYLTIVKKGLEEVITCIANRNDQDYSLYFGQSGVLFLIARYSELLGTDRYEQEAARLATSIAQASQKRMPNELLQGRAGMIVALHMATQCFENDVFRLPLELCVKCFLADLKPGLEGLYLDENPNSYHPLTGLAHGNSGIALALCNLSSTYQPEAIEWIIENLQANESLAFSFSEQNWRDHRAFVVPEQLAQALRAYAKHEPFQSVSRFSDAWCHGSPGIILSHLAFDKITNRDTTSALIDRYLTTTILDNSSNDSLCCGLSGQIYCLLESTSENKNTHLHNRIDHGLDLIMTQWESKKKVRSGWYQFESIPEPSLFKGIAGVGYMLTRVIKKQPASIFFPFRPGRTNHSIPESWITSVDAALGPYLTGQQEPFVLTIKNLSQNKTVIKLHTDNQSFVRQVQLLKVTTSFPELAVKLAFSIEKLKNLTLSELSPECSLILITNQYVISSEYGIYWHDETMNTRHLPDETGIYAELLRYLIKPQCISNVMVYASELVEAGPEEILDWIKELVEIRLLIISNQSDSKL